MNGNGWDCKAAVAGAPRPAQAASQPKARERASGDNRPVMPAPTRLKNATNFRDLASPLHSVPLRPGRLFRSDHLGALDEEDARQIRALELRRVLDFRGEQERAAALCTVPDLKVHSLAIEPTIVQTLQSLLAAGERLTAEDIVAHMQDTYRGFVRTNSQRFREFFGHLLESDEPTVFHCTAGKDRTGFAAALILVSLGASDEEVLRDYLLTNERLQLPETSRLGLSREAQMVLWRVQPEFLQAAWDEVERLHGSREGFLREALGLREAERERLRALYLRQP